MGIALEDAEELADGVCDWAAVAVGEADGELELEADAVSAEVVVVEDDCESRALDVAVPLANELKVRVSTADPVADGEGVLEKVVDCDWDVTAKAVRKQTRTRKGTP